jgi:hypothetical protein
MGEGVTILYGTEEKRQFYQSRIDRVRGDMTWHLMEAEICRLELERLNRRLSELDEDESGDEEESK